MTRIKIVLTCVLLVTIAFFSGAQDSGLGAGIILGEPTGITVKLWLSGSSAIDLSAGWAFASTSNETVPVAETEFRVQLNADYLYHFLRPFTVPEGMTAIHCGIGGTVKLMPDMVVTGVRVPAGIAYYVEPAPLEIFLEIALVMELFPATAGTFNSALGLRWFF